MTINFPDTLRRQVQGDFLPDTRLHCPSIAFLPTDRKHQLCRNHRIDALGGSAHALPPPLLQPLHCDNHSEGFLRYTIRKEDNPIAMRPRPRWGQGWRKGVDHWEKKRFSPEPKNCIHTRAYRAASVPVEPATVQPLHAYPVAVRKDHNVTKDFINVSTPLCPPTAMVIKIPFRTTIIPLTRARMPPHAGLLCCVHITVPGGIFSGKPLPCRTPLLP